jgi:hypothetical protein
MAVILAVKTSASSRRTVPNSERCGDHDPTRFAPPRRVASSGSGVNSYALARLTDYSKLTIALAVVCLGAGCGAAAPSKGRMPQVSPPQVQPPNDALAKWKDFRANANLRPLILPKRTVLPLRTTRLGLETEPEKLRCCRRRGYRWHGLTVTPAAVLRSTSAPRRCNAGREQDPAHGRPRQSDALVRGQHLGQVLLIGALIFLCGQLNDSSRGGSRHVVTSAGRPG